MNYTVTEILREKPWSSPDGTKHKIYYDVMLAGVEGKVNLGRNRDNPLQVGATLDGTVAPDDKGGQKFTADYGGFKGGGNRESFKADPAKQRAIIRQSAQKAALEYASLRHQQGKLPEDFNFTMLKPIVDWFYDDACEAMNTEPGTPISAPSTGDW